MRTQTQFTASPRHSPKQARKIPRIVDMSAVEFHESFSDLLRGALLYAEEREWIESRHGRFASDELSREC
jgi:hypothetical protein